MLRISKSFIDKEKLIQSLKIARMEVYYKDFINQCVKTAVMMDFMVNVLIFFILMSISKSIESPFLPVLTLLTLPLGFYIFFSFFLKTPDIKIIRSRKNIDAEIISAIRFLVLDLKANASIFASLENIAANFDEIGRYLKDIIVKVQLGSPLVKALDEAVELVPSESFRVFLWQLINHIQTGTDITHSLEVIADEIVENQKIEFKKYGKKLNVISLMYMIIAIILPTIGFTIISAGLLFLGVPLSAGLVVGFWIIFSVLQLLFLVMSGGNRPVVES